MKVNNFIHYIDHEVYYHIVYGISKKPLDIDLTLGDYQILIDKDSFKWEQDTVKQPLFPSYRVKPLHLKVDSLTLVMISVRPAHLLFNTSLDPNNVSKEVIYSKKDDRIRYLFFNFSNEAFSFRGKLTEDKWGLVSELKKDLTNNHIRQAIINLLNFAEVPEKINSSVNKESKYKIEWSGDIFIIMFNSHKYVFQDQIPLQVIVYIIHKKLNTEDPLPMLKALQQREFEDDEKYTQLLNLMRYRNRILNKLKDFEAKNNIPEAESFSNFIVNFVKINENSIKYTAPLEIKWEFGALPKRITD